MNKLIGQTVEKVLISDDQECLRFLLRSGQTVDYIAYGDCCSYSYFSDVNRLGYFIGEKILNVEAVELMQEEYTPKVMEYDVEAVYGFRITTKKGVGLVIMRNESNGYYGGSCELGSAPKETVWHEIKDYYSKIKP